jgi:hypothetical protein
MFWITMIAIFDVMQMLTIARMEGEVPKRMPLEQPRRTKGG